MTSLVGAETGENLLGNGKKLANKVTDVGNRLGKNDFFGPILEFPQK